MELLILAAVLLAAGVLYVRLAKSSAPVQLPKPSKHWRTNPGPATPVAEVSPISGVDTTPQPNAMPQPVLAPPVVEPRRSKHVPGAPILWDSFCHEDGPEQHSSRETATHTQFLTERTVGGQQYQAGFYSLDFVSWLVVHGSNHRNVLQPQPVLAEPVTVESTQTATTPAEVHHE